MLAELNMPRMRTVAWRPSGRCHIAGAERSCAVRSVTLSGFDNNVSRFVAEPRSLDSVNNGVNVRRRLCEVNT